MSKRDYTIKESLLFVDDTCLLCISERPTNNSFRLIVCMLADLPEDTKSRVRSSMTALFPRLVCVFVSALEVGWGTALSTAMQEGEACWCLYDVSLSADSSNRHVTLPRRVIVISIQGKVFRNRPETQFNAYTCPLINRLVRWDF